MAEWLGRGQRCASCGGDRCRARYADLDVLRRLVGLGDDGGMWKYFDVLPLEHRSSVVTLGEGSVAIDNWRFLEEIAREFDGTRLSVWVHRQDQSRATGTFKDLSGSLLASSLREHAVRDYVCPSTGNIGCALARYLRAADIDFYAFLPLAICEAQEAGIGGHGQRAFRVRGDYAAAKESASKFARDRGFPLSAGTFDPHRIEAKKTMAFEWKRLLADFPTVYIQALSGGTGPIGVEKGCAELLRAGTIRAMPRQILVQSSRCAPMAEAYREAKRKRFRPAGWEEHYRVREDPRTAIATLATGDPVAYPYVARLVHESRGDILSFDEDRVVDVMRMTAFHAGVQVGPAAAIAVGGFFEALRAGSLRDGDVVLINIGEGMGRSPEFMERCLSGPTPLRRSAECTPLEADEYRRHIDADVRELLDDARDGGATSSCGS